MVLYSQLFMFRGVGRTFKRGVMSEAFCDYIVHVVVILRIVTEKHIILAMMLLKGNVLQLHLVFPKQSVIHQPCLLMKSVFSKSTF